MATTLKPVLCLALALCLQLLPVHAQSLAAHFTSTAAITSLSYREYRHKDRVVCLTTKAGVATAVVGATVFFIGRGQLNNNINTVNQAKQGLGLYFGGLAAVGLGLGTAIGGGIHDVLKAKKEGKFGLIYTTSNQIGVAYKF